MIIDTLTPPAAEPVSVAQAKARLRLDHDLEDGVVGELIAAARERVESLCGRALITRGVREIRDRWDADAAGGVRLARGPLRVLSAVSLIDEDGGEEVLDPTDFIVDIGAHPGRIGRTSATWPTPRRRLAGIRIDYDAGYGVDAASVPEPLREAVLAMAVHAYEHRGGEAPRSHEDVAARVLIAPYAPVRL